MRKKTAAIILTFLIINVIITLGFIYGWFKPVSFEVEGKSFSASPLSFISKRQGDIELPLEQDTKKISPLSGVSCENYNRRAFAVMLASDNQTRPLSGLTEAEIIFEMPVVTGGITRLMAVYLCQIPKEIGSVRSARHDFIPLAMGLDAIFVHWGGSHFALDILKGGIMDNINALSNSYGAFYRKKWIPKPHNGFTSRERLINSAAKLGYRLENQFKGYPFQNQKPKDKSQKFNNNQKISLEIGYPYPYNVRYEYDPENNSYWRWRGGRKEIDKNTGKQIAAKNIVIMRASSRQIEGQYNDVDIEGAGECRIYNNGTFIQGTWKKEKSNKASKLYFLNKKEEEIKFVPGQIWIEIIEPYQKVEWIKS